MKNQFLKRCILSVLAFSMAVTTIGATATFYDSLPVSAVEAEAASQQKYTYRGIDVSRWQGDIDWEQVAESDKVDFVILRCGYGSNTSDKDDIKWEEYVTACEKYGIPYGVYLYSYATSSDMIDSEVNHIKRLLKGHTPSLPVYLDMEESTVIAACSAAELSSMAKRYCKKMENAGYRAGIYASLYYWYAYLDSFAKTDTHYHWVAQYNSDYCAYADEDLVEQYNKTWAVYQDYHYYETWQYSSTGSIPGISGNVDLDYWYGSMDLLSTTTLTNTAGGVKIEWNSTPQAAYYYIYRKEDGDDSYEKLDYVTADTLKYVDTDAVGGTLYDYKVKMRTQSGFTEAGPRAEIVRLKQPVISTVKNYSKGIKVTWNKIAGADGYYLYRKASADDDWERIEKLTGKSTTTYKDTSVKAGKLYYYTVRAYCDEGYTGSKDADGSAYYRLNTPELKKAVKKSTYNKLTWNESKKADGYIVYRKTSKNGTWKKVATIEGGDTTYYKDKAVKKNKTYYYTVRAYRLKGGVKYISTYDGTGLKVKR